MLFRSSDPYGEVDAPKIVVSMPGLVPGLGFVSAVDTDGRAEQLESQNEDYFEIELTRARMGAIDHFKVADLAASGGGDSGDGGCTSTPDIPDSLRLLALFLFVFMLRRAMREEKK